jgi:hypothetical protein
MNDHQRRLKVIELTMTPRQVVAAWLKNAIDAGTFEDGARRTPPAREVVANAVRNAVRNSMKGQAEPMIQRAVLQGRREADLNYNLVINVNAEVITSWEQRRREAAFLLGYLSAEMRTQATKDRVHTLRLAVLMFLESVITLTSSVSE